VSAYPWHPILAAMVPVLSMYANVPGSETPDEVIRSLLAASAVAAVLLVAASLAYRDVRKAGLLVTLGIVLFVGFNPLYGAVESLQIGGIRPLRRMIVIPATYVLLAAFAWAIGRMRRSLLHVTSFANVVAIGCLVLPLFTVGRAQVQAMWRQTPRLPLPVAGGTIAIKPDIYYVIFDRYGDESTIRQHGLDNTPFYSYLESKGFYVARESRSNYIKTVLSLASSFNMSYLDPLQHAEGSTSTNWRPIYHWLHDGRLIRFLKSQGYRYVHAGSWYWPTVSSPSADRNVNFYTMVPYAAMRFLDTPLMEPIRIVAPTALLDSRRQQWHRVRRQIDDLVAHAADPGPTFTFLHILVPHKPFVFDSDGSYVSDVEENRRTRSGNYVNQVLAANAMAVRLIDAVLRRAPSPPVIILQGDEGPYPAGTEEDLNYNWQGANTAQLREKSGILNAYYLPHGGAAALYPTISPVNSFRVVANTYFGTGLPMLPDRVFGHESEYRPYALLDVTPRLAPVESAWIGPDNRRHQVQRIIEDLRHR
jgi:hypothetical protein